jgi:hypothetical protein
MAGIFEGYRCQHHPDAETRIPLAMAYLNGETTAEGARSVIRRQDRWMRLEMESSSLAGILIEPMVEACPAKKFILTMRDVYSWCDSWLDHNINSPPQASSPFARLDRVRLRVEHFSPTKYDAALVARGFAPLASYFHLWQSHNMGVLDAVPDDRLFVVRTTEIIARIPDLADWLGVPAETLKAEKGWLFAASKKHRVLAELDPVYVRETANEYCGALMQQYFPGMDFDGQGGRKVAPEAEPEQVVP